MSIKLVGYNESGGNRFQSRINKMLSNTPAVLGHALVKDVIMFPDNYFSGSGIRAYKAIGLYSSAGDLIPSSCLFRNHENLTQLPSYIPNIGGLVKDNIEGTYLYGGYLSNHYGHLLTESVSRLWYYQQDPSVDGIAFCGGQLFGNTVARSILNELGVANARFLIPKEPVRIEQIIIPQPSMIIRLYAHQQHAKLFRNDRLEIVGLRKSKRPLYLSRRLLTHDARRVVNEGDLEDFLMRKGIQVEHPQFLTLREQVGLVNEHEIIIGLSGSALHTILFARMPKKLIHLCSSAINTTFALLDSACNNDAVYLNCVKGTKGEASIDLAKVWLVIEEMIEDLQ